MNQFAFVIISRSFLLRMSNVSDKSCREHQNTHFVFSRLFFSENLAVCEIMWKIMLEPDRPRMTIWRMRIAWWVSKDTNTLGMCNTYFISTATVIALTNLIVAFIRALPVFKKSSMWKVSYTF